MDLTTLTAFAVTFAVAAAIPGPNMVALVSRVLGRGQSGVFHFCLGMVIGDVVWLSISAGGLVALAHAVQPLFMAIRYLGAAYLLYLAWKLWTSPARLPGEGKIVEGEPTKLMMGGVALALGNPKIMLFYFSLLPAVVPMEHLSSLGFAELMAVMVSIYSAVLAGYVVFALRARRLLRSLRAIRIVNRASGAVMAGAAAAVATQ